MKRAEAAVGALGFNELFEMLDEDLDSLLAMSSALPSASADLQLDSQGEGHDAVGASGTGGGVGGDAVEPGKKNIGTSNIDELNRLEGIDVAALKEELGLSAARLLARTHRLYRVDAFG